VPRKVVRGRGHEHEAPEQQRPEPPPPVEHPLLALQRAVGNQALARTLGEQARVPTLRERMAKLAGSGLVDEATAAAEREEKELANAFRGSVFYYGTTGGESVLDRKSVV